MNARTATKLANSVNQRTISEKILDDITSLASKGCYMYITPELDPLAASSVKYAFTQLGYKVEPYLFDESYLKISWYNC